ncbi:DUF2860 family protein [Desulfosarcina cetonica]|uniref:DUF2860 family protein n=1 Tax=Desulfosarcina cetonica TaxID=90730 RepID=UPI001FEEFCAB|nr:DUF2860 family protein [Desulfosarcina cetonica]
MVAGNNFMDVGTERIDSLTDEPDSDTTGMGMLNFELAYTLSATRTQFTLGSQLEDIAQLQLGQQLAIKQELPDKSIIMAGFLFSGIPTEVWKDPYVTDSPRQETDRDSAGARLVFDRILGSKFELRYTFRNIEIDDEASGRALGLSRAQRDLLRRDGTDHWLDLNYRFTFQQRHVLIPSITYFVNDRDGDAMSNEGLDFQLTYLFFNDPLTLVVNGRIGAADYDRTNPIYGRTREDDRFGADVQVYYKNPFGWEPFGFNDFSVFAMGTYWMTDANIDFYDTEVTVALAGMMVRF